MQYSPQSVRPSPERSHLAICYKNFGANKNISHIGLGVTALTNAQILNAAGYWTEVWSIISAADLVERIDACRNEDLPYNDRGKNSQQV